MNRIVLIAASLFAASLPASADVIQFIGPTSTVNDGVSYVLPYEITINGTPQLVTCFDGVDDVYDGNTWTSSILNIGAAAASGFFPGVGNALAAYEEVAWLSVQAYSTPDQQVGLQHAIWSVFGPTAPAPTPDSQAYLAAANAAAATGYAGFNFTGFYFIQQPGAVQGGAGVYQAFVFDSLAGSSADSANDPEPATVLLFVSGLVAVGYAVRVRRLA